MAQHIDSTAHENGATGQVYHYEADYTVRDQAITWTARVNQGDAQHRSLQGDIPLSSPAMITLAEQVVRDEIVKQIDTAANSEPTEVPMA